MSCPRPLSSSLLSPSVSSSVTMSLHDKTSHYSSLHAAEVRQSDSPSSLDIDEGEHGSPDLSRLFWHRRQRAQWRSSRSLLNSLWFHAVFLVANLLLFGVAIYSNGISLKQSSIHSDCMLVIRNEIFNAKSRSANECHDQAIFKDALKVEERRFNVRSVYHSDGSLNMNKSNVAFSGPPRPELEQAWSDILSYQNFHVQEHELGEYKGQKSLIKLTDGSGYYMTVAVQHALHCVQRLHRYMYKDHYHSGLTESEAFDLRQHTEHCLDWLRQYVQCNADTSLLPIRWAEGVPTPVSKDWGKHKCMAWEPIVETMAQRAFDPFTPGLIVHPVFGDPFAKPSGAQTGAIGLHGGGYFGGDHEPDDY